MKILQILNIIFLICLFSLIITAQIDVLCLSKVFVQDSLGNQIKDAKVKMYERDIYYSDNFKSYTYSRLLLPSEVEEINKIATTKLKIKSKGFESFEKDVRFRCGFGFLRVTLKKDKLNETANLEYSTSVTGFVTDETKGIIIGAKVKATDKVGKLFETKTDEVGFYRLDLFPQVYALSFEGEGFETFSVKNLVVENSTESNTIQKDVIMKGRDLEPCGYSGADCFPDSETVETPKVELPVNNFLCNLEGKVIDPNETGLPNVQVTAIDNIKNIRFKTSTNSNGNYCLNIPVGEYTIEFLGEKGFLTTIVKDFYIEEKNKYNFNVDLGLDPECSTCMYSELVCKPKEGNSKEFEDCVYASRKGDGSSKPKIIKFSGKKKQ